MDDKDLFDTFTAHVARYEQHQSYIAKARAQLAAGKFSAAVVDKVILDHGGKADGVASQIRPLLPRLDERKHALGAEAGKARAAREAVDESVQELELRHLIGELDDAQLEADVADLRLQRDRDDEALARAEAAGRELQAALDRWIAVAGPGEMASA
jgi:hypothetical protein